MVENFRKISQSGKHTTKLVHIPVYSTSSLCGHRPSKRVRRNPSTSFAENSYKVIQTGKQQERRSEHQLPKELRQQGKTFRKLIYQDANDSKVELVLIIRRGKLLESLNIRKSENGGICTTPK